MFSVNNQRVPYGFCSVSKMEIIEKIIEDVDKNLASIQQLEMDVKQSMAIVHEGSYHQFSIRNIKTDDAPRPWINFSILLGNGTFKRVKLAADPTGLFFATTSLPSKKMLFRWNNIKYSQPKEIPSSLVIRQINLFKEVGKELEIQKLFAGHTEFVQVTHSSVYRGAAKERKHRIAMEFCEKNLATVFSSFSARSLSEEQEKTMIDLLHGFLLGVAKMQKAGVIHRDLKPENVLVKISRIGGKELLSAKITDFGFAIYEREAKTAEYKGTPLFLSPELIKALYLDRLAMQKRMAISKINQITQNILSLRTRLDHPDVKNDEHLSSQTRGDILAAEKNLKRQRDLSNSYGWTTHGKSDVWACGLIIFQFLYEKHLYDVLETLESVGCLPPTALADQIKQVNINKVFEGGNFTTPFEKKLLAVAKRLLVVNQDRRPDQVAAYLAFCSAFNLEPAHDQLG